MEEFLGKVSSFVWGGGLIFLLLFTGAVYTVKLRFIQFKTIPFLLKNAKKFLINVKKFMSSNQQVRFLLFIFMTKNY